LAVPAGSVFGFLGPNGSGKTTTIRMLLGLASATSGVARLFGEPMPAAGRAVLPRVGALVEGPACYPFLSGRDNLRRLDAADRDRDGFRDARIDRALERVGLTAAAGKRYRAYSLGMRQRLGLAATLLRPRDLLILDEPTNGLDPQGTREVRALIRSLAADGTTVFLSSHLLAEVEQVCTHAAVMRVGRLVTQGSVEAMRAAARPRLRVVTPDPAAASLVLARCGLRQPATDAEPAADGAVPVSAELTGQAPEDVCAALVSAGVRVRSFGTEQASLEDAFVALTGEGFDVAE
jgi:ABC-2 type transport system ATP-binding protein